MNDTRTRGKCVRCRIVYRWHGKPLLRDAYCDRGHKLARTTHLLRGFEYATLPRKAAGEGKE